MEKSSKISYKTYFNDKLKKVKFGKIDTYPLYVQVSFERKTTFFKSNFFELFSKTKYILDVAGSISSPTLEQIIELELQVIEYTIKKHAENFNLAIFKKEYNYYSQDICDLMEEGFRNYLYTFLEDKGLPALAIVLRDGSKQRIAYDIIQDFKKVFVDNFYDEMVLNSIYYAPPYLPLYDFIYQTKYWPMIYLSIMEWEDENTKTNFSDYLKKMYTDQDAKQIIDNIEKHLKNLLR